MSFCTVHTIKDIGVDAMLPLQPLKSYGFTLESTLTLKYVFFCVVSLVVIVDNIILCTGGDSQSVRGMYHRNGDFMVWAYYEAIGQKFRVDVERASAAVHGILPISLVVLSHESQECYTFVWLHSKRLATDTTY